MWFAKKSFCSSCHSGEEETEKNCETIVSVPQLFMQKAPEKYGTVLPALEHVFQWPLQENI